METKRLIIAGSVFLASLLVLFVDAKIGREEQAFAPLLSWDEDEITAIEIDRAGTHLDLFKQDDAWRIREPLEGEASPQIMTSLLYYLAHQEQTGAEVVGEDAMAKFGLAQPRLEVTVKAGEASTSFMIGDDTPISGESYARISGSDEVFWVASVLRDLLNRRLADYRNRALLTMPSQDVQKIVFYQRGESAIELNKNEEDWTISRPSEHPADAGRISEIISEIYLTPADDFIDTDTLALDLGRFGLDVPAFTVTVAGGGETETLSIGNALADNPDSYYAQRSSDPAQLRTVPAQLVESLRAADFSSFRSKNVFELEPGDVASITFQMIESVTKLQRDSAGLWQFVDEQRFEVDQAFADQFLARILGLRIERFLDVHPPREDMMLDDPLMRINLVDASGRKMESLVTGRGHGTEDYTYAERRNETAEVIGIRGSSLGALYRTPRSQDFAEKTLFKFDPALVRSMEIKDRDGLTRNFAWVGDRWQVTMLGQEPYQVDPTAVDLLVRVVIASRWESMHDPSIERDRTLLNLQELGDPVLTVFFRDATGQDLLQFGLGSQPNESRGYIRRGTDEFFSISRDLYTALVETVRTLHPQR